MVKVGIIGVGTVSQMMHLPILSGLHDLYQITAVSDVSPTQLKLSLIHIWISLPSSSKGPMPMP